MKIASFKGLKDRLKQNEQDGCSLRTARAAMKPSCAADTFGLYTMSGSRKYLNAAERRRVLRATATLAPDQRLFVLTLAWTGEQ